MSRECMRFRKTRFALICNSLLNEPLMAVFNLIAFIMHKDLKATALQIAALTMIRPLMSIFSLYWSSFAHKKRGHIRSVVFAGALSRLPFFFFPWVNSPWAMVASVAIYIGLSRGSTSAWMEILRRNLPDGSRGVLFSASSGLAYLEGVALALGLGFVLDHGQQAWRWVFPLAAAVGMLGVLLQARLPKEEVEEAPEEEKAGFWKAVIHPWRTSFSLLQRPDFRQFQIAFMLGGIGIMVIQPALPLFFVEFLNLSYTDLAIALSVCKGIGFAVSSPMWGKAFGRWNLSPFLVVIFAFMGAFPLLLLLAPFHLWWLYVAYTLYGISQSGSHLLWNLSGPLFSKNQDSSSYTSVNVLMVGLRGAIAPPLGSLLCSFVQPGSVFLLGGVFFALGSYYMLWHKSLIINKKWMVEYK